MRIDTEVFFRPAELGRAASSIPAGLYRQCRAALACSVTDCAFVPVSSMQLLAVITHDEMIFVDSLNYAVQDGHGGRVIMLAWDLAGHGRRDDLDAPVPVEIVTFHEQGQALHGRLVSELAAALAKHAQHAGDAASGGRPGARILPFHD